MLLAQMTHESTGFKDKEEIACKDTGCPGLYEDNVGLPGRHYYGRGFLQLTWGTNYKAASQALGLKDKLLENPDLVASSTEYAMRTSTWYWDAHVKPVLGDSNEFGLTTKAINGALECAEEKRNERAVRRYEVYQKVAKALNIKDKYRALESGSYDL